MIYLAWYLVIGLIFAEIYWYSARRLNRGIFSAYLGVLFIWPLILTAACMIVRRKNSKR